MPQVAGKVPNRNLNESKALLIRFAIDWGGNYSVMSITVWLEISMKSFH